MKKILLLEIFNSYDVEDNIINRNCIKCLLKSMIKKEMCSIDGQYYLYCIRYLPGRTTSRISVWRKY